jgi:hypothetical protein
MWRQVAGVVLAVTALVWQASTGRAAPDPPGAAVVCVARGDHILMTPGVLAPHVLFPKGRVDFRVVEKLIGEAMKALTGKEGPAAWRQFVSPLDRVAIMVDVAKPPVQLATVEIIIDGLVGAGVSPDNICVFGDDEGNLFNAGFTIRRQGPGVRAYGAESEGYRGGISRIPADCQVLLNVATLRADPQLGLTGCVANCLACVPTVERLRLRGTPELVPSVAAHPALRPKLRLNFLEAYLPVMEAGGDDPPTYQYRGLIVGSDPVAVDTIGARILQGCRDAFKHEPWPLTPEPAYLRAAQKSFRLGQGDPAQITVELRGPEEGAFLR